MTEKTLTEGLNLSKKIDILEEFIKSAKTLPLEYVLFSHGNGSERVAVCDDKTILEKVRELVVKENELKLKRLKSEFSSL